MDAAAKFEEYKLFSELVQRLSERRQTASQTYLTVNTAAFGVLVASSPPQAVNTMLTINTDSMSQLNLRVSFTFLLL